MRRSSSMATLLLAAGAGWLAANMWRENTGGIRDRFGETSSRLKARSQRLLERGSQMTRQGREKLRRTTQSPEGTQHHNEDYGYEDWRYYRPGEAGPAVRRPYDER